MSFAITNKQTPKATYSQPVRFEEVHSDEEAHKKHAHSAKASSELVLTAPQPRKHFIARSDKDESGKAKAETTPVTTLIESDLLGLLGHSESEKQVKVMEAKHELLKALEAWTATPDNATEAAVNKVLTENKSSLVGVEIGLISDTDHTALIDTNNSEFDSLNCNALFQGKTAADYKRDVLDPKTAKLAPIKANAKKVLDAINGNKGLTEEKGKTLFAEKKFGSGFWGTAAIAAGIGGLAAGIQWFMGNNAVKAAEAKADAAKQETEALKEQIQGLLQQLGQVMMSMQAKGEKANAQLTNLVARLIKLQGQSLKTASAPAHGSASSAKVASKIVRSDDTSATPPNPPAGEPNLDELEKQVKALEQAQASGGGKPAPAQPQGGGTPHTGAIPQGGTPNTGAMPQPVTMPQQNGQATESPMPQQPETQRIRFHRFPEDARNGAVPTNAFLGDKVITRKVSNTGDRAIIEKDDDC